MQAGINVLEAIGDALTKCAEGIGAEGEGWWEAMVFATPPFNISRALLDDLVSFSSYSRWRILCIHRSIKHVKHLLCVKYCVRHFEGEHHTVKPTFT